MSELKTRTRDDGVVVLDGAQSCTAYVSVFQMGRDEDKTEFADGTPLADVEAAMDEVAQTLLTNRSDIEWGWYAG